MVTYYDEICQEKFIFVKSLKLKLEVKVHYLKIVK